LMLCTSFDNENNECRQSQQLQPKPLQWLWSMNLKSLETNLLNLHSFLAWRHSTVNPSDSSKSLEGSTSETGKFSSARNKAIRFGIFKGGS
jgi:hypothetical protein